MIIDTTYISPMHAVQAGHIQCMHANAYRGPAVIEGNQSGGAEQARDIEPLRVPRARAEAKRSAIALLDMSSIAGLADCRLADLSSPSFIMTDSHQDRPSRGPASLLVFQKRKGAGRLGPFPIVPICFLRGMTGSGRPRSLSGAILAPAVAPSHKQAPLAHTGHTGAGENFPSFWPHPSRLLVSSLSSSSPVRGSWSPVRGSWLPVAC